MARRDTARSRQSGAKPWLRLYRLTHIRRLAFTLSYVTPSIPHFVSLEMRTADAF